MLESKGASRERRFSKDNSHKTFLLVSGLLLRKMGAGQVDFCYVEDQTLRIVELKSSLAGAKAMNKTQYARLRLSGQFISEVTGLSTRIDVIWD